MEKCDRTLKTLVLFLRLFDRETIGYPKETEPSSDLSLPSRPTVDCHLRRYCSLCYASRTMGVLILGDVSPTDNLPFSFLRITKSENNLVDRTSYQWA